MSRAERRAAERRAKKSDVKVRGLSGAAYIIMAVVTFAMIFSSFGWVLNSGGTIGMWVMGVLALALIAVFGIVWWRRRSELE